jgi:hypothetical protein
MSPRPRFARAALLLATLLALTTVPCLAKATMTQELDPRQVNVGDPAVATVTIEGGTVGAVQFPPVDGLEAGEMRLQINSSDDDKGTFINTVSLRITLIPTRPGDFFIPGFDIHTQEGDVVHVRPMKLRAVPNPSNPATALQITPTPPPSPASGATPLPPARTGPVVMPSANAGPASPAPANGPAPDATTDASGMAVPREKDGTLPKVFMIITPETTNAYIGQAVGMTIDFYIRMDVATDQNSLPTIVGSDFLMNSFTTRGRITVGFLENQQYARETWKTAIAAPKSGDFPLSMQRDTYWIKSYTNTNITTFFGNVFGGRKANLAHEMVSSNSFTMHVIPLPEEGRPAHFSGAIGHFQVGGEAQPDTVAVGEPVTLRYNVMGDGNFDYVRCPVLPDDPAWKAYTPRSGTNYQDESHLHAVKIFEQSVIPRMNGNVPLPVASFSYFDPTAKQYVTIPIALTTIVVTGTPPPLASSTPEDAADSVPAAAPKATDFLPNRLELGSLQGSLQPAYREPWFWAVQVALVSLPFIGAVMLFIRTRLAPDAGLAERELRRKSVRLEEDAMSAAVRDGDAHAFFIAARHAVQLQLGTQWGVNPEALTLGEIRRREPELAERFAPLFAQADVVIYSGTAITGLDLAQWEQSVRAELLQPQPA